MLKKILLLLALCPFCIYANYSYEYYKDGRETLKSSNIGNKKSINIENCYNLKDENISVSIDCDINRIDYEQYAKLTHDAFFKLRRTAKESQGFDYYSLYGRNYCLIIVDKNKSYDLEADINPCITIYIPVNAAFNESSKYSIATGLASLMHENFHILYPPFKGNSELSDLLVNEYAASLITLNSYRILNRALDIPFEGRWTNSLAEQFLLNPNMNDYCTNFSILRKKNKKIGTNFDSMMGGVLAHIFSSEVVKDPTLLKLYIHEEINSLFKQKVSGNMLLHRLGLCGKPAVIHENITKALLPTKVMEEQLAELFGYNFYLLSGRDYSQNDIESFCADAVYKNSCKIAYVRNANLSDDRSLDSVSKFYNNANGKFF
ncbi:hypothetical protein [Rheinheimera hassiensis]|uniref:hypothetical protein n=1 Tax=Rheinheimera hassiensis TaxID=1193627 RepID=UPI001F05301F|nr:hypothetical protein [Rheinheimera hassiensis]